MITSEYIDSKMNSIINADCLEVMKQVPDNYFDLVLTDPPYGIGISGQVGGGKPFGKASARSGGEPILKPKQYAKKSWDKEIPKKEFFDEMTRISKNTIIFGGNYFIEHLTNSPCWIVWDKDNSGNFADSELAWTNFKTAVRNYKFRWNGMLQQQMQDKEERFHPTQKPHKLFQMILRDYAIKLDKKTVFDPFMGSGTTAIACQSLGLEWCGCELEADYVAIANKRLSKVQASLF